MDFEKRESQKMFKISQSLKDITNSDYWNIRRFWRFQCSEEIKNYKNVFNTYKFEIMKMCFENINNL
jgi:hypothetical protein